MSFDVLYREFAGNTVLDWSIAVGVAVVAALVLRFLKGFAVRRAEQREEATTLSTRGAVVEMFSATRWYFYLVAAIYAGSSTVALGDSATAIVRGAFITVAILQVGLWVQMLTKSLVHRWGAQRDSKQSATMAAGIVFVANLLIWSVVGLLVLANLGIEVSALIAGLGIGGIAIALALQGILTDLFASLSMYFDRPFDIGDFIIVGDFMGVVNRIGLRTTRVNGLGGEQIVFANGDLVKSRIRNYARMEKRRVVFDFSIEYGLPADKVERAATITQEVIEQIPDLLFDRVHFKKYGDYALDFEAVYYSLNPDFNVYMQKQHEINLGMYRRFEAEGIPFAIRTQTLHLRGGANVGSATLEKLGTVRRKGDGEGRPVEAGGA